MALAKFESNIIPGGVIIDAVAELSFLPKVVQIDWDQHSIRFDGGKVVYETGLSAEEIALCLGAVWFGSGHAHLGAVSQNRVEGIWQDSVIARHLMIADGVFGGVVYGYDCHHNVFRHGAEKYSNPFLSEVDNLQAGHAIPDLAKQYLSNLGEAYYQVYFNFDAVKMEVVSPGQFVVNIGHTAFLGERTSETTVAEDGKATAKKYPQVWNALQHFADPVSLEYYLQLFPSWQRLPLIAICIALFRRLKIDGVVFERSILDMATLLIEKRERCEVPWENYAIRSRDFEFVCVHAANVASSRAMAEKDQNICTSFEYALLGLKYSAMVGQLNVFYSLKELAIELLPRVSTNADYSDSFSLYDRLFTLFPDQLFWGVKAEAKRQRDTSRVSDLIDRAMSILCKAEALSPPAERPHLYDASAQLLDEVGESSKAIDAYALASVEFGNVALEMAKSIEQIQLFCRHAVRSSKCWVRSIDLADQTDPDQERVVPPPKALAVNQTIVALMKSDELRDHPHRQQLLARLLREEAAIQERLNCFERFVEALDEAVSLEEEVGNAGWAAYTSHEAGIGLLIIGNRQVDADQKRHAYVQSAERFTKAIYHRKKQQADGKEDVRYSLAESYKMLGEVCGKVGEWSKAAAAYEACYEQEAERKNDRGAAHGAYEAGMCHWEMAIVQSDPAAKRAAFTRCKELFTTAANCFARLQSTGAREARRTWAISLRTLGHTHYKIEEYEQAVAAYDSSYKQFEAVVDKEWMALVARDAAKTSEEFACRQADSEAEKRAWRSVCEWQEKVVGLAAHVGGTDAAEVRTADQRKLGEVYGKLGEWSKAAAAYEASHSFEVERDSYGWAAFSAFEASKCLLELTKTQREPEARNTRLRCKDLLERAVTWRLREQDSGIEDVRGSLAVTYMELGLVCWHLQLCSDGAEAFALAYDAFHAITRQSDAKVMASKCAACWTQVANSATDRTIRRNAVSQQKLWMSRTSS